MQSFNENRFPNSTSVSEETTTNNERKCMQCGQHVPPRCPTCSQFVLENIEPIANLCETCGQVVSDKEEEETDDDDETEKGYAIKESRHGVGHARCLLCNRPTDTCPRCETGYDSNLDWTEDEEKEETDEEDDDDDEKSESDEDEQEPKSKKGRRM